MQVDSFFVVLVWGVKPICDSLITGLGIAVINKYYFRPKIILLINFVHALQERHE